MAGDPTWLLTIAGITPCLAARLPPYPTCRLLTNAAEALTWLLVIAAGAPTWLLAGPVTTHTWLIPFLG